MVPHSPPITTVSPTRTGRSKSRIRPLTKLLTTFCRPKPMPTPSAPATMAKFCSSTPITPSATSTPSVISV
jgi:hypothetical protein